MKKLFSKRVLSALLSFVLLLSAFSVVAFAEEDEGYEPYEWEMSTDQAMLWNDEREYYSCDIPFGYKLDFVRTYYFANEVYSNRRNYEICSYARDGEILIATSTDYYASETLYYATEKGRKLIEDFVSGDYASVRLVDNRRMADMKKSTLMGLDLLDTGVEIDVTVLADLNYYEIVTYDSTDSVYHVYGALYEYEGGMWYLNYDKLSNDHFDADGNFSYRRGKVTLYEVKDEALRADVLKAEEDLGYMEESYYEEDDKSLVNTVVVAKIGFWIVFVAIGFALPAWTLVGGIKNSRSETHGKGKHWLIMSLASGVWILIAASIAMIILLG